MPILKDAIRDLRSLRPHGPTLLRAAIAASLAIFLVILISDAVTPFGLLAFVPLGIWYWRWLSRRFEETERRRLQQANKA
jgi:hypothetical protein